MSVHLLNRLYYFFKVLYDNKPKALEKPYAISRIVMPKIRSYFLVDITYLIAKKNDTTIGHINAISKKEGVFPLNNSTRENKKNRIHIR